MLFLNKATIATMDQNLIQTAVEKAYRLVLSKKFNMPDRMHVQDQENMLLLMPCFSEKFFSTKLVSVFPEAHRHGQPAVNGVMVLSDNVSGRPLAVMDGAAVTAQRTGAVGGLAVNLLAPEVLSTAGIFGAGVQGLSQARYLLFNREIKTLYIYDLYKESARSMVTALQKEHPNVEYKIANDSEQLVENSRVIIAATTSRTPLFDLPADGVTGKVFISIGSFRPDMQEFPNTVAKTADEIFVDTLFAAKESGDLVVPLQDHAIQMEKIQEFARLFEKNTMTEGRTIFFKSVGMALFDLAVASAVYELAVNNSMGQVLDF